MYVSFEREGVISDMWFWYVIGICQVGSSLPQAPSKWIWVIFWPKVGMLTLSEFLQFLGAFQGLQMTKSLLVESHWVPCWFCNWNPPVTQIPQTSICPFPTSSLALQQRSSKLWHSRSKSSMAFSKKQQDGSYIIKSGKWKPTFLDLDDAGENDDQSWAFVNPSSFFGVPPRMADPRVCCINPWYPNSSS